MVTLPGRIPAVFGLAGEEDSPELGVARRLLALLHIQEVCRMWLCLFSPLFFNLSKKQALSHPRALLTVEMLRFLVNPNLEADIR